ncbi:MAG: YeeE/YedE family protein [Paracoccaceae bacterium]|nr:YeeE/YedE family protein [Paracoccaceae bacterium]
MDFVPLIDAIGEPATGGLIGLVLGLAFGALVLVSGFCTRSAVLDLTRRRGGQALGLWLTGFAVAVAGTQTLVTTGVLDLSTARFFANPLSLSGAVVGGALFGIGMVLARGCSSRLIVLAGSGNIRALFSVVVIALTAWAAIGGPLAVLTGLVGGLANTTMIGGNELGLVSGLGNAVAPLFGGACLAAAAIVVVLARLRASLVAMGVAIGALIPLGFWLTQELSFQVFEPVAIDSLSYIRPLAETVDFAAAGVDPARVNVDLGSVAGTVAGAFLAALLTGRFRIATFSEPGTPSVFRYGLGAVLMGFGGVLAAGCTVGAGLSGGSSLAVSSLIALTCMIVFGALTDLVVDKAGADRPKTSAPAG